MSQHVVRYEGEGKARRPVYADEGGSAAAAHDPLSLHGRVPIPGMGGSSGGAGSIERRQLTEAERSMREETRSSLLVVRSPAIAQEENVSDEVQEPNADAAVVEPRHTGLVVLYDAVLAALDAQEQLEAAGLALDAAELRSHGAKVNWTLARAALDAAYQALDDPPAAIAESEHDSPPEPATAGPALVAPDVAAEIDAAYAEAAASVALDGETQVVESHPDPMGHPDNSRLTSHERRVLAATIAHQGDRKAVAAELGLTAAINVEMALESIGRKGLLPMDLIPRLPARFAKYVGV